MKFSICIVPPGGGEADFTIAVEGSAIPRNGEYITVQYENGVGCYKVRYVTYCYEKQGDKFKDLMPVVEAEFVRHPYQSPEHKRCIEMYESRGHKADSYPESGY
jgi:hypothetical protein